MATAMMIYGWPDQVECIEMTMTSDITPSRYLKCVRGSSQYSKSVLTITFRSCALVRLERIDMTNSLCIHQPVRLVG